MNHLCCALLAVASLAGTAVAEPCDCGGLRPLRTDSCPGLVWVARIPVRPGAPCADSIVRVDLSDQLPPVGQQHGPSCGAWCVTYYHRTQVEWVERRWDLTDPRHQCSPTFTYNLLDGGRNEGVRSDDVAELICRDGVSNAVEFPMTAQYWELPAENAWWQAMEFRSDSAYAIGVGDTADINQVRQHLANGYTCAFGVACWSNFMLVSEFDNIYCLSQVCGEFQGYHGVTMVGYDDTLTTADGPGAFRLVNQWGTGWGDSGFCWISYVAAMNAQTSMGQAWFVTDRVAYQPTLVAWVHVSHPYRRSVRFRVGVGSPEQPTWSCDFPRGWGDQVDSFPSDDVVCDISDAESLLVRAREDTVFVACWDVKQDSLVGALTEFRVEHLPTGRSFASTDPPVAMGDSGETAYARVCVSLAGIEEPGQLPVRQRPVGASMIRSTLSVGHVRDAALLDAAGRRVLGLHPGANDVSELAPGVYFVREAQAVRKVAIAK